MANTDNTKPALTQHWEKRVLAAYLLMMGESWASTCSKVGRSQTTLATWRRETTTWEQAKQEAERRWLYDIKDVARQAVYGQVKGGDGDLGLKILERLVPELIPPAQKTDVAQQTEVHIHVETAKARVEKRLAALGTHNGHDGERDDPVE